MILMMAFLLPFSALEMRADEEVQIKKIPLWKDSGTDLSRDLIINPIESNYYASRAHVSTSILRDLGVVVMTLTNLSTGEVWSDTFDSGVIMQTLLPISGTSGLYEIEYITESGDLYAGEFLIE